LADALRASLGVEARMERGRPGVFTVQVGGAVVAAKSAAGFPETADAVAAVRAALAGAPTGGAA
jgi:hypothetical protein